MAALASDAGAAAALAGAEASCAGPWLSMPCFSPPISMSPPWLIMYRAAAAKTMKPTTNFHMSYLQKYKNKKALHGGKALNVAPEFPRVAYSDQSPA